MDLYGKNIYTPDVIKQHDIKVVIVAIPVYYTQIASQVEVNHRNVLEVIDICNLIKPDFVSPSEIDFEDYVLESDESTDHRYHAVITEEY